MVTRLTDPRKLDVEAFARAAGVLEGQWPLLALARLAESACLEAPDDRDRSVGWAARGELRQVASAPAEIWLHLSVRAELPLRCQRCLQPTLTAIDAQRSFRFVPGETAAAELDAECEDDILALTRALDLQELIEDEALLALPLVPKHEQCPQPLELGAGHDDTDDGPAHPFAVLAGLKRDRRPN